MKLDHCVIHVSEWSAPTPSTATWSAQKWCPWVSAGPIASAHAAQRPRPGTSPEPLARVPAGPGGGDLCFEWEGSIEEAVEHLRRNGVEVELGPVARSGARGDGTSVYFRDPDGSLLELISYS